MWERAWSTEVLISPRRSPTDPGPARIRSRSTVAGRWWRPRLRCVAWPDSGTEPVRDLADVVAARPAPKRRQGAAQLAAGGQRVDGGGRVEGGEDQFARVARISGVGVRLGEFRGGD